MIDVLGVLMGIDMQGFSRPEGSDEMPPEFTANSSPPTQSSPPPAEVKPEPPSATADFEMEEVDKEEANAKKEAEEAKKAGADAYKKKDFDEAIKHFKHAWDVWPKDITFLTNLGGTPHQINRGFVTIHVSLSLAAYFEKGDYDEAIEACEKAVEEGRSVSSPKGYLSAKSIITV